MRKVRRVRSNLAINHVFRHGVKYAINLSQSAIMILLIEMPQAYELDKFIAKLNVATAKQVAQEVY